MFIMLKNIPSIISPELMYALMNMGHGDEICFGDANFPADSMGQRVIRADGHKITELLEAVLELMPLDIFVDQPAVLMDAPAGDEPGVWKKYDEIIRNKDFSGGYKNGFEKMERFAFYDRARECYAVVATGESEGYANIILKKGVIL
ncbi:L-fucose mutarotase [Christensenella hongkongensis]|uniref:L-fucose mutarotase n=3 Tax=Christensenella hongkongensis TaxID=270498 RepID=A0A0M2NJ56_9FIRM|nr:L-fucose mutarotase [Christensenella hongkongensis]